MSYYVTTDENNFILEVFRFQEPNSIEISDEAKQLIASKAHLGHNRFVVNPSTGEVMERADILQAEAEQPIRDAKKEEIRQECLLRINAHLPQIDTFKELELLRTIASAFQLSLAGEAAKEVYLYARTKLNQADTLAINLVEAYDPSTDTGWPS